MRLLFTYILFRTTSIFRKVNKELRSFSILVLLSLLLGIISYTSITFGIISVLIILFLIKQNLKFAFLFLLLFLIGFTFSYISLVRVTGDEKFEGSFISGRVIELNQDSFNQKLIINPDGLSSDILIITNKYPKLSLNDEITVEGSLTKVDDSTFTQSYKKYLKSKKVFFLIQSGELVSASEPGIFFRAINFSRDRVINAVKRFTSEPESSLLTGVLIGDNGNFSKEFDENLIQTGTSHIVSVSGFNVSLIYIMLSNIYLITNRKFSYIFSLFGIIFYCSIVGFTNLPATRACIMICYVIIAKYLGHKPNITMSMLLSILLPLILFPLYWENISFQLSIASTVGLFILAPKLNEFFESKKLLSSSFINENLSSTLACTIATLPFSIFTFNGISFVSIPVNIMVLPVVSFITIVGFLSIVTSIMGLNFLTAVILNIAAIPAKYIISVVNLFGNIDIGYANDTVKLLLYSVAIIFCILLIDIIQFRKIYIESKS